MCIFSLDGKIFCCDEKLHRIVSIDVITKGRVYYRMPATLNCDLFYWSHIVAMPKLVVLENEQNSKFWMKFSIICLVSFFNYTGQYVAVLYFILNSFLFFFALCEIFSKFVFSGQMRWFYIMIIESSYILAWCCWHCWNATTALFLFGDLCTPS